MGAVLESCAVCVDCMAFHIPAGFARNLDRARGGGESQAGRGAAGVGLIAATRAVAVDAGARGARRLA